MRSDNPSSHRKTEKDLLSLADEEIEQELRSRHEARVAQQAKRQKVASIAESLGVSIPEELNERQLDVEETLHQQLLNNKKLYLERIAIGEQISKHLIDDAIPEESLSKDHKYALDLYRKQQVRVDITSVKLRLWQQETFKLFDEAENDRKVIWICGANGNEGKSWFQNYVEAYFGYQRVFRSDLRVKHKDICNILKKRGLSTVNIFLFNDARSTEGDEHVNMYRILEDIKDGAATASKYDSQVIKFKTPNTVMVFSNDRPNIKCLSADRWEVYVPTIDGLKVIVKPQKQKEFSSDFNLNEHMKKLKFMTDSCIS